MSTEKEKIQSINAILSTAKNIEAILKKRFNSVDNESGNVEAVDGVISSSGKRMEDIIKTSFDKNTSELKNISNLLTQLNDKDFNVTLPEIANQKISLKDIFDPFSGMKAKKAKDNANQAADVVISILKKTKGLTGVTPENVEMFTGAIGSIGNLSNAISSLSESSGKLNIITKLRFGSKISKLVNLIFGSLINKDGLPIGKSKLGARPESDLKLVKESSEVVVAASESLKDFSKNIMVAGIAMIPGRMTSNLIWPVIDKMYDTLTRIRTIKHIENASKSLITVSSNIGVFSKNMAISGIALIPGLAASLLLYPTVRLTGGILGWIGDKRRSQEVTRGSRALAVVGVSMLMFSGGMALTALLLSNVSPIDGLKMAGLVLGTSIVFGLAGKIAKPIIMGSLALGVASIALVGIGLGIRTMDPGSLEWEDIGKMGAVIGGMALTFGIAGLGPIPLAIAAGAIALGLAGLSLIGIGAGLKSIKSALSGTDKNFGDDLTSTLGGLGRGIIAFASGGQSEKDQSLFMKLAKGTIGYVAIAAAIPIMLGIGLALPVLAKGVETLKRFKGIKQSESDNFRRTVTTIGETFAIVGGSTSSASNVLSYLSGVELGPTNIQRGIKSVMDSGDAMKSVTDGISYFNKFTNGIDIDKTSDNIGKVLSMIGIQFSAIGKDDPSLMSTIFGGDFGETDVENGIESVLQSGEAFKSIAQGIKEFKSLESLGITEDDFDPGKPGITRNIGKVLGMIQDIFGKIGKKDPSLMSLIFGGGFGDTDVENGIDAIRGVGDELVSISNFVSAFGNLEKDSDVEIRHKDGTVEKKTIKGVKIEEVKNNISNILNSIFSTVAGIGSSYDDNDTIEDGIEMLNDISKAVGHYVKIANNLKSTLSDEKITPVGYLATDIKSLIDALNSSGVDKSIKRFEKMGSIFKGLAKSGDDFEDFVDGFSEFVDGFEKFKDHLKDVKDDNVKVLKEWVDAMERFVELNADNLEKNTEFFEKQLAITEKISSSQVDQTTALDRITNTGVDPTGQKDLSRRVGRLEDIMKGVLDVMNDMNDKFDGNARVRIIGGVTIDES